jgi:hypothetical protein
MRKVIIELNKVYLKLSEISFDFKEIIFRRRKNNDKLQEQNRFIFLKLAQRDTEN